MTLQDQFIQEDKVTEKVTKGSATFMDRIAAKPLVLALLTTVLTFIAYQFTLAPGPGFIDAGELATDCYTLGIAHPTGYPLFVIIGWIFSHLPIAATVIGRLNEMAALFTALGAGALTLASQEVFANWFYNASKSTANNPKDKTKKQVGNQPRTSSSAVALPFAQNTHVAAICAVFTGIAGGLSATWWEQSTSIEVYPLHLFLISLTLYFFLRFVRLEDPSSRSITKHGIFFAVSLGLSFTNHLTTILLAPAFLYLYFSRFGFGSASWGKLLKLAVPFVAALLVYLYLPIRSSQYPLMDWGHPASFDSFMHHVTGGQYKVWMFTKEARSKNWSYFWSEWPREFTYLGAVIALLGIYQCLLAKGKRRGEMAIFTLLLFFSCIFYAINYNINDIDSYFLLAYLTTALWIGAGFYFLSSLFIRKNWKAMPISTALFAVLAVLLLTSAKRPDESGNHMVENYTKNALLNLPKNAIVFSSQWDFWVSGAFYYQLVEKMRPDVLVIDKAMLRDRPWYFSHLQQRAPKVMAKVKNEEDAFLYHLKRFDAGLPFDGAAISATYRSFTDSLVSKNLDRPIFISSELINDDADFAPSFKRVPAGQFIALQRTEDIPNVEVPKLIWRDKEYRTRNYYTDNARLLQVKPLMAYARAMMVQQQFAKAKQFVDATMIFQPDLSVDISSLPEKDQAIAVDLNETFVQLQQLQQALGEQALRQQVPAK